MKENLKVKENNKMKEINKTKKGKEMKTKTKETIEEMDVIFLLDRSGSMMDSVTDTIGGYNSYLDKQRKNSYNTKITTILFDNEYQVLHDREDIKDVKNLTEKEYFVRGSTALLDAIGLTITNFDKRVGKNKVLFVITTDGLENSSCEYTKDKVKNLISKHPTWEFLYIGANIDSYSEGLSLGIKKNNISNYQKTKKGTRSLFKAVGLASDCLYECKSLDSSWKKELEK